MRYETITLYGEHCPWQRGREIVIARPITYGIAQIAMTPFATSWTSMGDIVAYDQDCRVTGVIIRNSRTFHGQFRVDGLNDSQISNRSRRLASFLSSQLIGWTFVSRFPGLCAMSVDVRLPLERLLDVADKSPGRVRIMQCGEGGRLKEWTPKGRGRGLDDDLRR
jgi:hypothetical protein